MGTRKQKAGFVAIVALPLLGAGWLREQDRAAGRDAGLARAAAHGDVAAVERLLDAGADPNARVDELDW